MSDHLFVFLASHPTAKKGGIVAALVSRGVPEPAALRCYNFTQIAWGRVFLDGMGIQFSEDYLCFDAAGRVVATGKLRDEPCFTAAQVRARQFFGTQAFEHMALTSADVQVTNSMLGKGSKAKDLSLGPSGVFLAATTAVGLQKAHEAISRHMRGLSVTGEDRVSAGGEDGGPDSAEPSSGEGGPSALGRSEAPHFAQD